jgi:hypothetical protein
MRNKVHTYCLAGILILFFSHTSVAKTCKPLVLIDSTYANDIYNSFLIVDTFFNAGDMIALNITITTVDYACSGSCLPLFTEWEKNNTVISSCNYGNCFFTISDTGSYTVNIGIRRCLFPNNTDTFKLYLNVLYRNTTWITKPNSLSKVSVYPNISGGIFQIRHTDKNLQSIRIVDSTGRTVLYSSVDISQIDLSDFQSGIYYYAITDEKENIFRGKIVKE